MANVLVVSPDIVDTNMAGPGIRAWELANALSAHHSVTLAVPNESQLKSNGPTIIVYSSRGSSLREAVSSADALLTQGFVLQKFPFLKGAGKPIIVDLYDPFVLENLEVHDCRSMSERHHVHSSDLAVLLDQLKIGDFFVCSSERQRDYWLGMLSAAGRINPFNYRHDKSLRRLIDVVPFGLPEHPPQHSRSVLKGVHTGISPEDKVIIWGGGLWAWLDPLTLVRAMVRVSSELPHVKLFFMGKDHPNPEISAAVGSGLRAQVVRLSKELGLHSRTVFFNDRWVEYDRRQDYLLEADLGVCLHRKFIEMRYAFRTRLLDCVWCGLPILCSRGDTWSQVVEDRGLGRAVSCEDVEEIAAALIAMLSTVDLKKQLQPHFASVAAEFRWSNTVRPLLRYLADPRRAPDKVAAR